ncbi:hypothetical protein Bca4012_004293 [Brassica carinata]|uniref:Zinc knuckle CX2CX4HX4C domain-containing protein n=1 Tax=Brassica carinata TaxID=52824 RepID=A0A8X7RSX8_BRACI|nr:hypothetical protein Bca52824_041288 [Brassica carinata]
MTQSSLTVPKGGSSTVRSKLELEDEIIRIPDCDLDAVADRFRLTLIGRVFNLQGRSINALIHLLPRNRIWNVEGRVRGINLGNGYLLSVLNKRPCHFNQWSFALERWEPFTSESFPNNILLWISVTVVPVHFWNDPTFIAISKPLGTLTSLDSKRARFQVSVNVNMPLQFERRIEFPNGDIERVSFTYEGLHRYCFTCHMISPDENACPQVTPEEREHKRQQRAELRRHLLSSSNQSYSDYRREGKTQKHSPSRDTRNYHTNHNEPVKRNHSRKEDVWRRIELPPRASSAYGKSTSPRGPRRENPEGQKNKGSQNWRPRSPPRTDLLTARTLAPSRTSHQKQDAPARAASDSQRTISEQFGQLELCEINTSNQPKSPTAETAEDCLRRIKGKSHITDTPTSRDREPHNRSSSLTIRGQQENDLMVPQSNQAQKDVATSPIHTNKVSKNLDIDLDIDFGQDFDISLTEDELALVDSTATETEHLEMDAEMLDNNDLLDETPDDNAEKIDANSQLSLQQMLNPLVPPHAQKKTDPIQDTTHRAPLSPYTAKGYLKKHIPKNPELKGAMASKKLGPVVEVLQKSAPSWVNSLLSLPLLSLKPPSKKI